MADTVKLHYAEAGRESPVVLLHGFPLSSAIWQEQQRSLSDKFRVITPDLRGHGNSPAPSGAYTMEGMAQDVLALLDSLGITKAAILGHSMGGYIALTALKLAPERFAALGLIASQAGADTEDARQNRYRLAERVAKEGSKVVAEAMIARLFSPDLPADSPIIAQVHEVMRNTQPAGIIGSLHAMALRPDSTELLRNASLPILLLAGARDQIVPQERTKALAAILPKAKLVTMDQAGHMPMLEQPEATTTALRQFLNGIR
jgi:3-oxoadipate enol-lactonase